MKLLYAANSVVPSRAANSVHVMKMCAAFVQVGCKVTLLLPDFKTNPSVDIDVYAHYNVPPSFEIVRLPVPAYPGGRYKYAYAAARYAKDGNFDVHYGRDIYVCTAMVLMGLTTGYEIHTLAFRQKWFTHGILRRFFAHERLVAIVAISDALRDLLTDQGLPARKLRVEHDGADEQPPPEFHPAGKPQVGYVGHLYPGRGIELIFAAAAALPQCKFVIAGGTEKDINYWRNQIGGLANVELLGFISPAETVKLRRECNILLAPYQRKVGISDGRTNTADYMSPLKIFEYMSAGRAIVCSDLPVLREVLNEKNACLLDPEDQDSWTRTIGELAADATRRRQLGLKAYQDFSQHYTWRARAQNIITYFKPTI